MKREFGRGRHSLVNAEEGVEPGNPALARTVQGMTPGGVQGNGRKSPIVRYRDTTPVRWFLLGFLPRLLFPATAGCITFACSHAPEPISPVGQPAAELPAEYAESEVVGSYEPLEWWKAFDDPVLNQVIAAVLASNFDLAEVVARIDQARAREGLAKSPAFPLLQPAVGVTDFDMPTNAGIGAQLDELGLGSGEDGPIGIVLPDRLGLTTFDIGLEFAYELDFWGRNRNDALAAGAELMASESDYLSARMGVLAETVRTYLEIVNLRRQQKLSGEIVEILQQRETLAESRYEGGLTDLGDVHTARRSLREAQAELPQIEALLADAEGRLWILAGGYRGELADMLSQPLLPTTILKPVPAGIPADLMVQRPDVLAAMQRMEAARYSVGARRADLWPRLSLQGSIGLQSTDSGQWFDSDQWFRNLSVNLLGPLFQGPRLRDNIALAEARLEEATMAFGRSVVTAVNEVEAALAGLEANRRRHSLLVSLTKEAEADTELQEQRYTSGVADYEGFLTAAQIRMGTESALAAAERDLGFARLALHRALGGSWTSNDREAPRQELPIPLLSSRSPTE